MWVAPVAISVKSRTSGTSSPATVTVMARSNQSLPHFADAAVRRTEGEFGSRRTELGGVHAGLNDQVVPAVQLRQDFDRQPRDLGPGIFHRRAQQ